MPWWVEQPVNQTLFTTDLCDVVYGVRCHHSLTAELLGIGKEVFGLNLENYSVEERWWGSCLRRKGNPEQSHYYTQLVWFSEWCASSSYHML